MTFTDVTDRQRLQRIILFHKRSDPSFNWGPEDLCTNIHGKSTLLNDFCKALLLKMSQLPIPTIPTSLLTVREDSISDCCLVILLETAQLGNNSDK